MTSPRPTSSFDAGAVRRLLRRARSAALCTLDAAGGPFASLVDSATDLAGRPVLLLSRLAWHTRNLLHDERASLLFADLSTGSDPLDSPRVTLLGRLVPGSRTGDEDRLAQAYLAWHPRARLYAGFEDFGYWRFEPETVHLVAGFGRIETRPAKAVFLGDADVAWLGGTADEPALARDAGIGGWRIVSCDPDGCVLGRGDERMRHDFAEAASSSDALERNLAAVREGHGGHHSDTAGR